MMLFALFLIIGLFCLLLEGTILSSISLFSILPNLTLVVVVCTGLLLGDRRGRFLGLILGLLQDLFFAGVIGYYGLIFYLLGYFSGLFRGRIQEDNLLFPLVFCFLSDLFYGFLQYFIYRFFKGDLFLGFYFVNRILPEAIHTSLVFFLVFLILRGFARLLGRFSKGKEALV